MCMTVACLIFTPRWLNRLVLFECPGGTAQHVFTNPSQSHQGGNVTVKSVWCLMLTVTCSSSSTHTGLLNRSLHPIVPCATLMSEFFLLLCTLALWHKQYSIQACVCWPAAMFAGTCEVLVHAFSACNNVTPAHAAVGMLTCQNRTSYTELPRSVHTWPQGNSHIYCVNE